MVEVELEVVADHRHRMSDVELSRARLGLGYLVPSTVFSQSIWSLQGFMGRGKRFLSRGAGRPGAVVKDPPAPSFTASTRTDREQRQKGDRRV
jgi:hypothetical protein